MVDYILAVDGGGSKTAFCIADVEKKNKVYFYTGSTSFKSVGIKEAQKNLELGLGKIQRNMDITFDKIKYSVFGLSGIDCDKDYEILARVIMKAGVKENFYLCNDSELALYAASDIPGIIVIAGTGSIVLGINSEGKKIRIGGWSYDFSDLGSGFWIGKEILKYTVLYCDGCYSYHPIFSRILSYYNIDKFKALPVFLTGRKNNYPEIASLARLVIEGGKREESLPLKILDEAAYYLAQYTYSVYKGLSLNNTDINIVMSGGVMKNQVVMERFKIKLTDKIGSQDKISFITVDKEPVDGGIVMAQKILHNGMIH
ncbi:N-acetylglucosamine kinase [Paramaledivibacter caminithermalis]|jgi:N-acetylglucosamine kinase-like BadF-type ATPase|uniref:BadF-type ATPase n=1 Tax=Paramaledivibacter caminithermalis (strain DSM 15212 / CIP 107654 / DViRD3) TaxID=1121301 RepID=A0A1M6RWV4_PARC5|nr:BadF/BadG/BcrA/BcrD ATPase family protein [Paramaledivibacter caminithermalis]SHK36931.1 BadF-type ATPase [Paramaledivibacter caminithermalis DSM 15212]